jgi:hypothetical protein
VKLLSLGIILSLLSLGAAFGQQSLYSPGAFPPGDVYRETDLDGLDDTPLSTRSYLVGTFPYVCRRNGLDYFTASGLLHILIVLKCFNNRPTGLALGKAIVATPQEPLTLIHVGRLTDGVLLVVTESWSKP